MGNAEQAQVTGTAYDSASAAYVTVQNTGSASVSITSASIDSNAATINGTLNGPVSIAKGQSAVVTVAFQGALQFTNTAQYTIKLQTAKGNTLTTTYTYTGAPSA
jgi:hypothetical protein